MPRSQPSGGAGGSAVQPQESGCKVTEAGEIGAWLEDRTKASGARRTRVITDEAAEV